MNINNKIVQENAVVLTEVKDLNEKFKEIKMTNYSMNIK